MKRNFSGLLVGALLVAASLGGTAMASDVTELNSGVNISGSSLSSGSSQAQRQIGTGSKANKIVGTGQARANRQIGTGTRANKIVGTGAKGKLARTSVRAAAAASKASVRR